MREFRRCTVCNKLFIATNVNAKYCSLDCRREGKKENLKAFRQREKATKTSNAAKTKKKQSVTEIAVAARKAGMTYGQYVAMVESGMAVERSGET